jgi:hypothetical protein
VQVLAAAGLTLTHIALGLRTHRLGPPAALLFAAMYGYVAAAYVRGAPRMLLQKQVSWERVCLVLFSVTTALLVWGKMGHMLRHSELNCPGMRQTECARSYFRLLHVPIMPIVWVTAQLPARLVFFPEMLRNLAYITLALAVAWHTGELTLRFALVVLAESIVCTSVTPVCVNLLYAPPDAVTTLLAHIDVCPKVLRHCRDRSVAIGEDARRRLLRNQVLLDMQATLALSIAIFVATAAVAFHLTSVPKAHTAVVSLMAITFVSSAAVKLCPSSGMALDRLAVSLVKESHNRTLGALRARLDESTSEKDNLRAGCDAVLALFPAARACALGTFAAGAGSDLLTVVQCAAPQDEAARLALDAALPAHVGASANDDNRVDVGQSSIWRVCNTAAGDGKSLLDSAACAGGLAACADWRAAAQAGLASSRALTLPLSAGPVMVGFLTLHLGLFAPAGGESGVAIITPAVLTALKELCDAVAGAVFVRRAFAVNREAFAGAMRAAGVPDADVAASQPPRRTASPTRMSRALSRTSSTASMFVAPFSENDAAALAALDESRDADAAALADWGLDAWALPHAAVCHLFTAMMHDLELLRAFSIPPTAFEGFMREVSCHYNDDNAFHNFRHAFTVTHTAYLFLTQSQLRHTRLRSIDTLALMLSAICHDLEHEGLTNAYHVNSGSALARLYNDASPNENNHCAVGFQLLDASGMLGGLSAADALQLRKLIVAAILATDMACHKQLLARVTTCLAEQAAAATGSAPLLVPAEEEAHQVVIVSFALHCADLCCPLLPPALSRRIADELSLEFAAQADLERAAGVAVTVMEAHSEVAKAKMEIGFLGACVRTRHPCMTAHALLGKRIADPSFACRFRCPAAVHQAGGG